jgi:hypothetical protein
VTVRVVRREIPADVLDGDPVGDKAYRQRVSAWVDRQWAEKDRLIGELLGEAPSAASVPQAAAEDAPTA